MVVQARKGSSGGVLSTPGDKEGISRGAGSGCEGFALRTQTHGLQAREVPRAGGREGVGDRGSRRLARPGRDADPPGGQREEAGLCRRRIESSSGRAKAEDETRGEDAAPGSEGKVHEA